MCLRYMLAWLPVQCVIKKVGGWEVRCVGRGERTACAVGHVEHVHDEQAAVVQSFRLEAQAGAAGGGEVGGVDVEEDVVACDVVEALGEGGGLVEVSERGLEGGDREGLVRWIGVDLEGCGCMVVGNGEWE